MEFEGTSVFLGAAEESIFQNQSGAKIFLTIAVLLRSTPTTGQEDLSIALKNAAGENYQVCNPGTLTVTSYTLESGDTIQAKHSDGATAWVKISIARN